MQRHIDTQIQALRQEFITMGLEVKAALEKAIISLKEDDKQAAKEVIEHDEVINNHETHLEKKTKTILNTIIQGVQECHNRSCDAHDYL